MRSADVTQAAMFSYRTLEERIPAGTSAEKAAGAGGWYFGDAACRVRGAVCRFWAAVDSARAPFAGELDPDALYDPLGAATGAAY